MWLDRLVLRFSRRANSHLSPLGCFNDAGTLPKGTFAIDLISVFVTIALVDRNAFLMPYRAL